MNPFKLAILSALAAASLAAPTALARADQPIETYYASLSAWDHIDGMGHQLTSVSHVLIQDRANFHNRHLRDPSDTGDRYFRRKENRREIPALLAAGNLDPFAAKRIMAGEPRVRVDRYADRLEVIIETNGGAPGPLRE